MSTYIMPESDSEAPGFARQSLEVFFAPQRVAIFGATEAPDSAGRAVMANLIRYQCGATLFPINPKRVGVLGIKAYPSLEAAGLPIDLAIVATPAPAVPGIIRECAAAGVKGAIIISAGFREHGPAGTELEQQIVAELRHGHLRVLGPNCLGVACPRTGINATFAPAMVRRGSVGFLSQSGALLTALLSPDLPEHVGCSAFISLGSMLDLGWAEWLECLGDDPQTETVGIYAEDLGDVRSFIRAVRKVTPHKPVILVKGRRAEAAIRRDGATGRLADRDDVLEDLFRRAGVLRVETIPDLLRMADVLATQPPPQGRRLTIVSNANGPAVLATDALLAEEGELAALAPATTVALGALLPAGSQLQNPIDLRDDAGTEQFARAAAIAARDPHSDALLLLLTPHATIDPLRAAELVSHLAPAHEKPILASWMWGAATPASLAVLNRAGIAPFASPEAAVRALGYLWRHGENQRGLHEDAGPATVHEQAPTRLLAERLVQTAHCCGRTLLTGAEARQLLAAYFLPAAQTRVAADHETAVELATALGYPVALVALTEGGRLQGDLGVVRLHAGDPDGVRRAYRSLRTIVRDHIGQEHFQGVRIQPMLSPDAWAVGLRSTTDPQLGPVVRLALGGPWAAASGGHVIALPPLTRARVRRLLGQPPLGPALQALYGRGVIDLATLEQFLVNFSHLVAEQRWIKEICIDPVLTSRERLLALDPLVSLHGPDVREEDLPEGVLRRDPAHGVISEKRERLLAVPLGLVTSEE